MRATVAEPRDLEMLLAFAKYKFKSDEKAIELLKKIAANNVEFHKGHSQLAELLVAGQAAAIEDKNILASALAVPLGLVALRVLAVQAQQSLLHRRLAGEHPVPATGRCDRNAAGKADLAAERILAPARGQRR